MTMKIIRGIVALCLVASLSACATVPVPAMTQAQADAYNSCMKGHWSSGADTLWFGYNGYQYHENLELRCQQYALAKKSDHVTTKHLATSSTSKASASHSNSQAADPPSKH